MLTITQFWGIFYETFSKFSCYLVSITVFSTERCYIPLNNISLMDYIFIGGHFVKNFPPVSYLLATDVTLTCHH